MTAPFINLAQLEAAARERLPQGTFDYFAGGAHDEVTLRENERAYARLALRPRVLVDVSRRNLETTVLGARLPAPILVAPMAFQKLAHADGELATARAAGGLGLPMVVSTLSTVRLEEIRAATRGPLWFQLYVHQDRAITRGLLERVAGIGFDALVLTVDTPVLGRRERDVRNDFALPPGIMAANVTAAELSAPPGTPAESALSSYFHQRHDASVSWRDIDWLRATSKLPVLLKGVVRGDDAARAVDHGADGVIVSNHGGRQLDTAIATVRALPEVATAAAGRIPVLVDGGIRRGTDVLKALALGATAVLVGRPVLWGLALDGERGAARVLQILRDELDLAMALCGCPAVGDVTADLVAPAFSDDGLLTAR